MKISEADGDVMSTHFADPVYVAQPVLFADPVHIRPYPGSQDADPGRKQSETCVNPTLFFLYNSGGKGQFSVKLSMIFLAYVFKAILKRIQLFILIPLRIRILILL
jgi:hypothetical protein